MVGRWASIVTALAALSACGRTVGSASVGTTATIEGSAPFRVSAQGQTTLRQGATASHTLTFTATTDERIVLGDVRWTFSSDDGDRVFATSGHGCGPSIDAASAKVVFACTEDYRYLVIDPDEPLVETITMHGGVGSRRMATGRFTFRQPVTWFHAGSGIDPLGAKGGEVTVVLTYDVRAVD